MWKPTTRIICFCAAWVKLLLCILALCLYPSGNSVGQAVQTSDAKRAQPGDVLAYLGEQQITRGEVDFQLARRAAHSRERLPDLPPAVLQSTIQLIAQQRQALQTLRVQKFARKREDVERWMGEQIQSAAEEKLPVAELIRREAERAGITEASYREHFTFRLSWQHYLQVHLTEKNVARHFENHKPRFDGTRYRIASIAIPVPAGASRQRDDAVKRLSELQIELRETDTDWKSLKQSIDAQSIESIKKLKSLDGIESPRIFIADERWIRGTGDEHPLIVSEILKLKASQVSEPIDTPTGIYLVKLFEIETGSRTLSEVRDEVRADMLMYLLDHLARESQKQLPLRTVEKI